MRLEIRIATLTDASAACQVLRRSISDCCVQDHRHDPRILAAWLGNKTPKMVASWFGSEHNFSLVALDGDDIIGVALLTRAGKLALCYLLPQAQRCGVGTALLARMEAQARTWDISVLQLHSTADGAAFYQRHGYIASGTHQSSYGVDLIFFWKPLDPDAAVIDAPRKPFCNCNTAS